MRVCAVGVQMGASLKRKRFFGAILMIVALIVMLLPATEAVAETSASDFVISKDGRLESYKGKDTKVTLPKEVKTIGEDAFANNEDVEEIILPDSVTKIEAYAFQGCENLRTVELGKGLTKIDDYAFAECEGLDHITIPSSVRSIGIEAFADCSRLEDITIPREVTSINTDAFARDYLLTIHSEAGSYADRFARDFYATQQNFVVKKDRLEQYKGSDVHVTVPRDVEVIGRDAFANNTTVEKITLPDSVKQIEAYAFWGCENLRTVELGKGLTRIDDYAFTNCDGLQKMTIPSNVRSIGIQAFADCNRLGDITIPPEVTSIKEDAFDRDSLLNILCEEGSYADKYAKEFYERQKDMPVYDSDPSDRVDVPDDGVYSGDMFPSGDNNQTDSDNSPSYDNPGELLGSTHVVGNQAVVLMQNSGLSVQNGAFGGQTGAGDGSGADGSSADEIPWQVAERTHYRDNSLTEESLAEDVREIGRFAYARSGLRNIMLPDGLEKIEYAAFYHCDDLNEVKLPASVTAVEAKAFAHTAWYDSFMAGSDRTEGDFLISGDVLIAYRGDSSEVTIPDGVRVIAGEAFVDHDEIQKLSIPESVQYVDKDAFLGCRPTDIEYGGVPFAELFSDMLIEEQINLAPLGAMPKTAGEGYSGPLSSRLPYTWILAGLIFTGGCVCMFRRAG